MLSITNVSDYMELAKQNLPRMVYDYCASGAEDQWTLRENREAFSRIQLRPRVLIDVSHINMSTSVLGYNISAAYKAIVLTVDASWFGHREADVKNRIMYLLCLQQNGFALPQNVVLKSFEGLYLGDIDKVNGSTLAAYYASQVDRSLSWKDIKWLKEITSLPILVKGILTAEDTRLAIECGVAGIIVSNHGGRQLDYVPATINCLEEVVREAKGRVPVFLDSGIRRGTDVFKALALGASGVFVSCSPTGLQHLRLKKIGRPVLFALAVDGEAGVRNALRMLRDELEVVMALSGCASLKEITRGHVTTESDRIRRSRM